MIIPIRLSRHNIMARAAVRNYTNKPTFDTNEGLWFPYVRRVALVGPITLC